MSWIHNFCVNTWDRLPACRAQLKRPIPSKRQSVSLFHVVRAITFLFFAFSPHVILADETQLESAINVYVSAMEQTDLDLRQQEFQRAEQLFRQLIEGSENQPPIRNANLLVNLGNAAIQSERIGPAIAAYRKALVLDPGNSQARQNLDYARSVVPDWIRPEAQAGFADSFFFWTETVSPKRISFSAAICFAIAVLLFVVGILKRQTLIRNVAILPFLFWLVLLSSRFSVTLGQPANDLVITHETTLYSADSENSPARVSKPLPSGAEVQVSQERDRWLEVRISDNISGWILKSKATKISRDGA